MTAEEKTTIIVATSNSNKAREFAALLPGVYVLPMPEGIVLPEETGTTFEENARLKAWSVRDQMLDSAGSQLLETPAPSGKVWVMADDSGIEIYALGGAPGIYSARYAGEDASDTDNVDKLLLELKGRDDRGARFVCVIVCVSAAGEELVAHGYFEGTIAGAPRGGPALAYDPVFIPWRKS